MKNKINFYIASMIDSQIEALAEYSHNLVSSALRDFVVKEIDGDLMIVNRDHLLHTKTSYNDLPEDEKEKYRNSAHKIFSLQLLLLLKKQIP